ncbi:MAG TPA: hypothetical protein VM095_19850 [Pyrinomonadaceae bacterium]|nr:hypothetical protein [Pyrinomonadaceae bacterium]
MGALSCRADQSAGSNSNSGVQESTAQATPVPRRISAAELKKLRWIEGSWRGTGDVEAPFYERYHFEGESTLVVESFADETLSKVTEVTRFELKDGAFGNAGEVARWAATDLKDDSVTFEPIAGARNTFRWQRESANLWKATLNWPALGDKPARQRVYLMERLPSVK